MPFRATIFDLDGTLLDTLDDIANAANRVLAARGFRGREELVKDGAQHLIDKPSEVLEYLDRKGP